ncbi:hypothetical protein M408DRAFT_262675 [Serendipita vermifera MAFF 305830]|uniref:Uncharacterized protein n=1 Tax=Serendipita vermifera MAFF 305830 TaxID=933852 RepID=A0A0C3AW44_SERVB|nr:hypothetical protein M408DRAFT_262675 [Serendipita vermifera MAFF 305830]
MCTTLKERVCGRSIVRREFWSQRWWREDEKAHEVFVHPQSPIPNSILQWTIVANQRRPFRSAHDSNP